MTAHQHCTALTTPTLKRAGRVLAAAAAALAIALSSAACAATGVSTDSPGADAAVHKFGMIKSTTTTVTTAKTIHPTPETIPASRR